MCVGGGGEMMLVKYVKGPYASGETPAVMGVGRWQWHNREEVVEHACHKAATLGNAKLACVTCSQNGGVAGKIVCVGVGVCRPALPQVTFHTNISPRPEARTIEERRVMLRR